MEDLMYKRHPISRTAKRFLQSVGIEVTLTTDPLVGAFLVKVEPIVEILKKLQREEQDKCAKAK